MSEPKKYSVGVIYQDGSTDQQTFDSEEDARAYMENLALLMDVKYASLDSVIDGRHTPVGSYHGRRQQ